MVEGMLFLKQLLVFCLLIHCGYLHNVILLYGWKYECNYFPLPIASWKTQHGCSQTIKTFFNTIHIHLSSSVPHIPYLSCKLLFLFAWSHITLCFKYPTVNNYLLLRWHVLKYCCRCSLDAVFPLRFIRLMTMYSISWRIHSGVITQCSVLWGGAFITVAP